MSPASASSPFDAIASLQECGTPIVAITAYDYPTARLCDEAGADLILIGDSLGMVFAGLPDTTEVTLDHMIYHTQVVARGSRRALLVSDLPYGTYESPEEAVAHGTQLVTAGAHAIKLEGGLGQVEKLEAMREAGLPTVGHIGMLPQRVREEGGYKKKGKTSPEADRLVDSAIALQKAGVGAIVLESIVPDVAGRITDAIDVPTIGIGSGNHCDGQIRVIHDVIGAYPWFVPPFAKPEADVAGQITEALRRYSDEVRRRL